METEPPDVSQLFFQYLRDANWHNWHNRHQFNPTERPEHALFAFLHRNLLPIYLGLLVRENDSMQMQFGLCPHFSGMTATVYPQHEERMRAMFAEEGIKLLPRHFLGAIINSQGRECPGNERVYFSLGTVMVRPDSLTAWSMTNFVFAAEIDEHGKAALLWMLEQLGPPHSPRDPRRQSYQLFDLTTIAGRGQPQVILELHCGQAGWREKSEATDYVGVGLTELIPYVSPEPVHFVRVVEMPSAASFRHATLIHRNPTETARLSSAPIWVCKWCSQPQTFYCPHLNGQIV